MAPTVIRYDGRTSEIFGLSLRVGFLTLITLGIYRFWATTRVRRWFWSRITVDDQRLEYSGTGFELFVAFVKVALVLVVVLIPLRLAKTFYNFAGIISLAQLLLLGSLYIFGGYYARRYRLTRTQWHGIRANLVGSSLGYLKLNVGYLLLTAVTLGVAYPYYRIATRRYLLDHTFFGDQKFSCTARARSLMGRWLIYVVVGLVLLGFLGLQVRDLALGRHRSRPLLYCLPHRRIPCFGRQCHFSERARFQQSERGANDALRTQDVRCCLPLDAVAGSSVRYCRAGTVAWARYRHVIGRRKSEPGDNPIASFVRFSAPPRHLRLRPNLPQWLAEAGSREPELRGRARPRSDRTDAGTHPKMGRGHPRGVRFRSMTLRGPSVASSTGDRRGPTRSRSNSRKARSS